jgi:hypothetical protein
MVTRTGHLFDSRGRRLQRAILLKSRKNKRLRTCITFFWLDPISSASRPRATKFVAQGLHTTDSGVVFLLGFGGVGIREHSVEWKDEMGLYKVLYAFIYRLYRPSHFADSSYRPMFDEEGDVIYTVRIRSMDYPGFCPIHARTPFDTRTHVLSNPSCKVMPEGEGNGGPLTVLKDQLCRTGRRFNEEKILSKIHRPIRVPGVVTVEAVVDEVTDNRHLSPGREKHRLGLRQMGSPFTSIPTPKKVLETLLYSTFWKVFKSLL